VTTGYEAARYKTQGKKENIKKKGETLPVLTGKERRGRGRCGVAAQESFSGEHPPLGYIKITAVTDVANTS
jgi:hypothetical protein